MYFWIKSTHLKSLEWTDKLWNLLHFLAVLFNGIQIVIVSDENERMYCIREIGEEVLPQEYGGRSKLVLLQDVAITPLNH